MEAGKNKKINFRSVYNKSKVIVEIDPVLVKKNNLKHSNLTGHCVKGFREVVKAIETANTNLVYLAKDGKDPEYMNFIRELKKIFKFDLVEIDTWIELKDMLCLGVPSEILIEQKKKYGKEAKISPKCHCAAIILDNNQKDKKTPN